MSVHTETGSRRGQGELSLAPEHYDKIATILRKRAGITLAEGGKQLVISRLSRRLSSLGHSGFETYLSYVTSAAGQAELSQMVDALTTNTTRFFREPEHFELMAKLAMPQLVAKARKGGRVRLWSAACSSGEEPYSIAATVLKAFPDAARYDVKILGTDISRDILARAQAGNYEARLARELRPETHRLMFETEKSGERIQVRQALRDLVTFRYLNFMEPWPVSGPFDVIFCRNVAIYMEPAVQTQLWTGLERVLAEDGLLFIGHSERIGPSLAHRLELFASTAFRRPRAAGHPSPSQ